MDKLVDRDCARLDGTCSCPTIEHCRHAMVGDGTCACTTITQCPHASVGGKIAAACAVPTIEVLALLACGAIVGFLWQMGVFK